MAQYSFGSGNLFGVRTDIANQTPTQFGVVQSVDLDFDFSLKELIGQYQAPVAIARAGLKITGKAAYANISAASFNNVFFGQTLSTGGSLTAIGESANIPTTPFQVTVANAANFTKDLGVVFSLTGVPLTRVASAPAAGQYSVNETTGVYTFASADTGKAVLISYNYNAASGASKISINNQLQGAAPTFLMTLAETYGSKVVNVTLNACVAGKLSLPLKNQDFTVPNLEFQAYADAAGAIGTITVTE